MAKKKKQVGPTLKGFFKYCREHNIDSSFIKDGHVKFYKQYLQSLA